MVTHALINKNEKWLNVLINVFFPIPVSGRLGTCSNRVPDMTIGQVLEDFRLCGLQFDPRNIFINCHLLYWAAVVRTLIFHECSTSWRGCWGMDLWRDILGNLSIS